MNTTDQAEARAAANRASWRGAFAITPRGVVAVTVNRLSRQISALDAADRAVVHELLAELTVDLDGPTWESFDLL